MFLRFSSLFFLTCRRELKTQVDWLPGLAQMAVHAASLRGFELRLQLAELLADRAFVAGQPIVRTKDDFERRLAEGRPCRQGDLRGDRKFRRHFHRLCRGQAWLRHQGTACQHYGPRHRQI